MLPLKEARPMTRNKKVQALLFVLTAALIAFAPSRPVVGQTQTAPTLPGVARFSTQLSDLPPPEFGRADVALTTKRSGQGALDKTADRPRRQMGNMPPWFIDKTVGIQDYKDDFSEREEIVTLAAWVDAGAQRGNPADMPSPAIFTGPNEWAIGQPDVITTPSR
jgi:hypothetical protein